MYRKPHKQHRGLHNPSDLHAQPGDVTMVTDHVVIDILKRTGTTRGEDTSISTPLDALASHTVALDDKKVQVRYGTSFSRSLTNTITLHITGSYCTRSVQCPVSIAHRDGVMDETLPVMFNLTRLSYCSYKITCPIRFMNRVLDQLSPCALYI